MSLQVCENKLQIAIFYIMNTMNFYIQSLAICIQYVDVFPLSGMSKLDYSLYPNREMQLEWLTTYLQAYKHFTKKREAVTDCELETLFVQVNKFALVSA